MQEQLFQHTRTDTIKKQSIAKPEPQVKKIVKQAQQKSKQGQDEAVSEGKEAEPSSVRATVDRGAKRACFHCKADHLVLSCPTASKEEKERLLVQLRDGSNKQNLMGGGKAKAKRANCVGVGRVDPSANVCLNGTLSMPDCADSGSDHNIIYAQHDAERARTVSGVQHGGSDGEHGDDRSGPLPTIHIVAGPVRCQDRKECLLFKSKEDEFVVGRALLVELVIDVDRQLEILAAQAVGQDDGPIDMNKAPDPVVCTQAVAVVKAINFLVDEAVKKGFPVENPEKLRVASTFVTYGVSL